MVSPAKEKRGNGAKQHAPAKANGDAKSAAAHDAATAGTVVNGKDADGDVDMDIVQESASGGESEEDGGEANASGSENGSETESAASDAAEVLKPVNPALYENLEAGDSVDVFCTQTRKWLPAKVEGRLDTGVKVHFLGWNKSSDEVITSATRTRIAPRGSNAAEAWAEHDKRLEKRKRGRTVAEEVAASEKKAITTADTDLEIEPTFVSGGATRSGRKTTKRLLNDAAPRRPTSTVAKKKKVDEQPVDVVPDDDLCAACGQIEGEELSDMILCDGGCLSSYHFSCIGLESAPEVEKWLCEQCRTNEQKCFMCGRNGTINEKGGVFRCGALSCGKFYHQSCISSSKLSRRFKRTKDGSDEDLLEFDAPFRCPRHVCVVCEDVKKGSDLMCCIQCPESYHPHCMPPSARYNSVGTLCFRHPHEQLPKIPSFYYNDTTMETITVDFNLRLPQLFVPKAEPDAANKDDYHHFRLLLNLVEDVRQTAPPYRKLMRNIYTFKQPPTESLEDSPMCVCKVQCGDDCINRLSFTECFGPAPTPGMKFTKLNKESNCMLGEGCGNRALHQKVYPSFEKFHTQEKGWGLRLLEPVKAGQLVIEYVGEVINEEEKERRLQDHAKNTPEDKNMYVMELSHGVYIDARFKGSVSRYINHACDPNCHLLKWRVKGVNRIAITALKDIQAGEELSYDYQFHTKQAMEWKCHCKSKNCRGTMAPEKINQSGDEPEKKLTKKEQLQRMKRAAKQEKLQQKFTARRLSLTSQLCGFGDTGGKSLVRTGPAPRELHWAAQNHVFLARNASRGFDFLKRKELKDRKIKAANGSMTTTVAMKVKQQQEENGSSSSSGSDKKRLLSPAASSTGSCSDAPMESTEPNKSEMEEGLKMETDEAVKE
ncbi:hypothetical protein Gpo141_00008889 [Globisporangium polare]